MRKRHASQYANFGSLLSIGYCKELKLLVDKLIFIVNITKEHSYITI